MASASLSLWTAMLVATVVMAYRDNDQDTSLDMQHEEFWNDVNGRFIKVSDQPRTGSFGMTWLVKDSQVEDPERVDDIFALKFLYEDADLLSIKSATDRGLQKRVLEGYKECAMQKHLAQQGKIAAHVGAQRFISCHETNIPPEGAQEWDSGSEDPLWVLMENGGDSTLLQWIESKQWRAELAQGLFKQLLEGLSFLASLSPAYIHHDLKPENCVIKQTDDGNLVLNIIDFGAAAEITPDNRFGPPQLVSTRGFFPWEYKAVISWSHGCPPPMDKDPHQNFASCPSDNCGSRCGLAFDMFAAGQIWFSMMLGDPSDTWGHPADNNHDAIEFLSVLQSFENEMELYSGNEGYQNRYQYKKFNQIVTKLKKNQAFWNGIQRSVDMMLKKDPEERIQAKDVLDEEWMRQIQTPNENDYLSQRGKPVQIAWLHTEPETMMGPRNSKT